MAAPSRSRTSRYYQWCCRHPRSILAAALLTALAAGLVASRLQLRTAFVELLPSNDPGVVALTRTQKRIGDLSLLLIGVHSPNREANLRYADALTERLRALPPHVISLATDNVKDVRAFFDENRWLYLSEEDLTSIRDRLRTEIGHRKNPLFVSLGGGDEDESIDAMRERLQRKDNINDRFPGGVFSSQDGQYVWIAALPPGGLFVEHAGEGLYNAAQKLVEQNPPSSYDPAMKVELAGPIATAIAERGAVENDLAFVTTSCLVIVALSIGIYFRRLRAIPLTGVPAAVGTLVAFAIAELAFGYLNSSTAFLGSIILGNGINYAIVLMSRYEEERARGVELGEALRLALAGTWRGTLVASISASAAYASLMVTSFRGFYQFGVMGAAGAIGCWIATYTALPAMLVLLDRRQQRKASATNAGARSRHAPISFRPLARFIERHSAGITAAIAALVVVSAFGSRHFLKDPFEYDFRKLSTNMKKSDEAKQFGESVDRLFGRWPSPTIVLADSLEEVEPLKAAIRKQDHELPGPDVIGQIVTVYDLLPGPPDVQGRKLALLSSIRKLTHDPALEAASEKERADLAKINPSPDLRLLTPADLPAIARRPFTEVDGTVGRVVLVYPPEQGVSVWSGRDLLRIASVLQYIHLANGKLIETSGSAVVFGAMIRSILHDGPIATVASLIAVLVIVAFTIRPSSAALMALGTLAVGVLFMVGAAGWAEVRVTFLNFIALPITFGIGAEYALNVVTRYREERSASRAVVSTGAAVALCSWTTIVGYGSLLAARNHALQGFGLMAVLGEVACLSAAILALPAFLLWRARRGAAHPGATAGGAKDGATGPGPGQTDDADAPEPISDAGSTHRPSIQ